MTALLGAETLEVLVLDVDKRLVEPTLARSLGKDRDALDEAIEKLRKLAPDKGVVELATFALDLKDGTKDLGQGEMKVCPPIPGRRVRPSCGTHLRWIPADGVRHIEIKPLPTPAASPHYSMVVTHAPDGRWSLSAATATAKGGMFVFEKIGGRPLPLQEPIWVASAVFAGEKPDDRTSIAPERWFSDASAIRSALLREPPNHRNRSEITMDQHPWSDTWKSYTKSTITFTASMGQGKHAGMLVSMLSLDYIPESRATSHTQIQGNFSHALAPGKLPISAIGTFDITFRNVELNGTTVTSTPSKKKTPAHHLQTLLFSTKS
jgi:hypothetical protein